MCGITGIYKPNPDGQLAAVCQQMVDKLSHRGPDGKGVWTDDAGKLAIGHSRLAIIDLSAAGQQPMLSHNGRYVISFNGEIYNFKEIRKQLESYDTSFDGNSDTEVLVEAFSRWGVESTLPKLIGMFALALWDKKDRVLYLIRDRLGIKPIYWGYLDSGGFLFASEIKALLASRDWSRTIDPSALDNFLQYRYIPTPLTIFKGIYKLEPGHFLTWSPGREASIHPYWKLNGIESDRTLSTDSDEQALDKLHNLLKDSIQLRTIADVPIGSFLSGGLDSSLVTAIMQHTTSSQVRTFSIGFEDTEFDESDRARKIATYLGTEHHELYATSNDLISEIPLLAEAYDEPFADSSQIPTLLVSRLARDTIKVALSGDGGDEVFSGYERYRWAPPIASLQRIPLKIRQAVSNLITKTNQSQTPKILQYFLSRIPMRHPIDKFEKFAVALKTSSISGAYDVLTKVPGSSQSILANDFLRTESNTASTVKGLSPTELMQFFDTINYLPDDILTKVDRASMHFGLEVRVPLLDHRLLEFCWQQPARRKIRGIQTKWMLRQILQQYLPNNLTSQPKTGFSVPLNSWLRGPLHNWVHDLIDIKKIETDGYLNPSRVSNILSSYDAGESRQGELVWCLIVFQQWLEKYQVDLD